MCLESKSLIIYLSEHSLRPRLVNQGKHFSCWNWQYIPRPNWAVFSAVVTSPRNVSPWFGSQYAKCSSRPSVRPRHCSFQTRIISSTEAKSCVSSTHSCEHWTTSPMKTMYSKTLISKFLAATGSFTTVVCFEGHCKILSLLFKPFLQSTLWAINNHEVDFITHPSQHVNENVNALSMWLL